MVEEELPGFSAIADNDDGDDVEVSSKKKNKKSGGFQSMGFNPSILKGIKNRGYKIPTPIQRKSIPLALEGRDVVAMARTGSGKTACFVLPILEKLMSPAGKSAVKSVRALILTPTRELALQTLRFVRELGKYTDLKANALLGGDSMEQQFGTLQLGKPDIIVATPGRFLHLCVEMDLSLSTVEIVVFDEGDRLFELGFGEQLREILSRLPISRQTLLFSATLPSALVEFTRAGLSDPTLLRLDVEWKLPAELWLGYVWCRTEQREAALLILLSKVISKSTPQVVVFTATRHHCEYLHLILAKAGIDSACIYSGLDSSARKIATAKFVAKKVPVLLVTDVAARGLDLPALDTVINYHFPAKPKLFVHRVGRSARAGRSGRAISIVSPDDLAHLLDLHLFLGSNPISADTVDIDLDDLKAAGKECPSCIIGTLPADVMDMRQADILLWQKDTSDITDMQRVCKNAWGQYMRCRENASTESNKRAKLTEPPLKVHPFFDKSKSKNPTEISAADLISQMKNYRPKGTILEIGARNDAPNYIAMKAKRQWHQDKIKQIVKTELTSSTNGSQSAPSVDTSENDLSNTFSKIVGGHSKFDAEKLYSKKKKKKEFVRDANYIPHQASNHHTETALAVNFGTEAQKAQLELAPDTHEELRKGYQTMRWDRKRKKMVHVDGDSSKGKMIRTESGNRIPASYRSGRFEAWKQRNNQGDDDNDDDDNEEDTPPANHPTKQLSEFRPRWMKYNERMAQKKSMKEKGELKTNQQILKERLKKQKLKAKQSKAGKKKKNMGGKRGGRRGNKR